jgi:hypothetical protein
MSPGYRSCPLILRVNGSICCASLFPGRDIAPAIDALRGDADALYVCQDLLTFSNWNRINTLTLGARLPTMQPSRESIEAS